MSYLDLLHEFQAKNIPLDTPSFYDNENFLAEEQKDSEYLNKYSAFVASRPYSKQYLEIAREKIQKIVSILHAHLVQSNRQGACIDISSVLTRILELEGIWCACLKGSLTIKFPAHSNEGDTHFYSVTKNQSCTPGHYWVYAPPFKIIDISIKEQAYDGRKKEYIPTFVMVEEAQTSTAEVEDIISPDVVRELINIYKIPKKNQISYVCTSIGEIQKNFPPQVVNTDGGARAKYTPTATHASIEKLEGFGNFNFQGLTPYELYKEIIEPSVKQN